MVLCKTKSETEDLCKELRTITSGEDIYYHHRGLDNKRKKLVEQKCVNDDFRVIVSTTTFAMGIDYAFDMVVLTFAKLFDKIYSWEEIQPIDASMILTLHQISRRSGHKPGLKSVSIAVGEDYEESLLIWINNQFSRLKNNDRKIWRRIVDLVELTKKCMSSKVCNTFFDEDITDGDVIQMTLNEFKSDMGNKLLIQYSVQNVYEKIRID